MSFFKEKSIKQLSDMLDTELESRNSAESGVARRIVMILEELIRREGGNTPNASIRPLIIKARAYFQRPAPGAVQRNTMAPNQYGGARRHSKKARKYRNTKRRKYTRKSN
jgi:hypothetical protein